MTEAERESAERMRRLRRRLIVVAAPVIGVFVCGSAIAAVLRPTTGTIAAPVAPASTATWTFPAELATPTDSATPMAYATPAVPVPAPTPTPEPTPEPVVVVPAPPPVEPPPAPRPEPVVTPSPAPVLVTVAGTVTFEGSYYGDHSWWTTISVSDGTCVGDGQYSDLAQGATVTVSDAAGETVATTSLQSGVVTYQTNPNRDGWYDAGCRLAFSVQAPESSQYRVAVAERAEVSVSRASAGSIALTY